MAYRHHRPDDPFAVLPNHCVPSAFATVAGLTVKEAEAMGEAARRTPAEGTILPRMLLNHRGFAYARHEPHFLQWAMLAGLASVSDGILRPVRGHPETGARIGSAPRRHTVASWVNDHPHGRFILFTRGHATACVNGECFGLVKPRARLEAVYEVLAAERPFGA